MKKAQTSSQFPTPAHRRKSVWVAGGVALLIAALVVARLAGLNLPLPGFGNQTGGADSEEHDYEAVVMVGPQGFTPQVLKVKPKTRVYFENQDTGDHSLDVSATPPDNSFVNSDVIPPNGGYGFTFIKSGTYSFHDGDNALANGQVMVGN